MIASCRHSYRSRPAPIVSPPLNASLVSTLRRDDRTSSGRLHSIDPPPAAASLSPRPPPHLFPHACLPFIDPTRADCSLSPRPRLPCMAALI